MRIPILILFLLSTTLTRARVITVGAGQAFPTLRQGIAASRNGDTVRVSKGTYREGNLVLDKEICLMGVDDPQLDGEDKYEILAVRADHAVISGFTFWRSGHSSFNDIAALRIYYRKEVTVVNNRFRNAYFGIYSQGASSCHIIGNTLSSNATDEISSANGIHCWKCDRMDIRGNVVTGHRDGLYFEFVTHSIITGNASYGNVRYGLHFMFSHGNTYRNNTFRNNGAGVAVMYSSHVTMTGNTFSGNWGSAAYGILMKDISDSHVEGNRFLGNTSALHMEGCSRTTITGNEFNGNGWAIQVQASCEDNTISSNNFTGNTFDIATNGTLVLNSFDGNYWDKYEGYDLDRNGTGDVPFRPVSMYSMIVERNPATLMLFHSFMVGLLDKAERVVPSFTPEHLIDEHPRMKRIPFKNGRP
jgi:nitrous oxidase accessory protein